MGIKHSPNEFDYINRTYGLSMGRGSRVEYTGDTKAGPRQGVITSAAGAHVNIRFDDDPKRSVGPFHPTWELRQLIGAVTAPADQADAAPTDYHIPL